MLDTYPSHEAGAYAEAAPVFVGGIVDTVVADGQVSADLALVGGVIGQMRFVTLWSETACENGCASNIVESSAVDGSPVDIAVLVKGRRGHMAEGAA